MAYGGFFEEYIYNVVNVMGSNLVKYDKQKWRATSTLFEQEGDIIRFCYTQKNLQSMSYTYFIIERNTINIVLRKVNLR